MYNFKENKILNFFFLNQHVSGRLGFLWVSIVIQGTNIFALKSVAAPDWHFSYKISLGKTVEKEMEYWEREDRKFSL